MVPAEPTVMPFRGQFPTQGVTVLIGELDRDLIEETVGPGLSVELVYRLFYHLFALSFRQTAAAMDTAYGDNRPSDGAAGVAV